MVANQIRSLLKRRDQAEAEIARLLKLEKKKLGSTDRWLAWCAKEFGWSRPTAYKHLDPKQLERDRAATGESRRSRQADDEARRALWDDLKRKAAENEARRTQEKPPFYDAVQAEDERRKKLLDMANQIVVAGYRAMAKRLHPDVGGSAQEMAMLTEARDEMTQLIENEKSQIDVARCRRENAA